MPTVRCVVGLQADIDRMWLRFLKDSSDFECDRHGEVTAVGLPIPDLKAIANVPVVRQETDNDGLNGDRFFFALK